MLARRHLYLALVFFSTCPSTCMAIPRAFDQFQIWYPQFQYMFANILKTHCQAQYNVYLYGTVDNTTLHPEAGAGEYVRYIQPTIDCILEQTPEYAKAALSVSQLILGLAPTILSFTSASTSETAMLSVIGKRPLLATLLCLGSPSIYINRAFEYVNPELVLSDNPGRYRQAWDQRSIRWRRFAGPFMFAIEYTIAIAAVINIALVCWDLALRSVCMVTSNFIYYPTSWALSILFPHFLGSIVLYLRARRVQTDSDGVGNDSTISVSQDHVPFFAQISQASSAFALKEFGLLAGQGYGKVKVIWFDETPLFLVLAWLTSLSSVGHLVWGTIIFSGMLFIGPYDAFLIFARLISSCLVCRVVLMFELARLREAYNTTLQEEKDEEPQGSEAGPLATTEVLHPK